MVTERIKGPPKWEGHKTFVSTHSLDSEEKIHILNPTKSKNIPNFIFQVFTIRFFRASILIWIWKCARIKSIIIITPIQKGFLFISDLRKHKRSCGLRKQLMNNQVLFEDPNKHFSNWYPQIGSLLFWWKPLCDFQNYYHLQRERKSVSFQK